MSKLLFDALESGCVIVTPRVAGEVSLNFADPSLGSFIVRAGAEVELTKRYSVQQLRKSNLRALLNDRVLRIIA